ncbi:signal peptide peptidase SppA [Sangeribacter muris]|jgi:protease-4|uniref:signal peptide peptidase SppA n=2 Tax=Bacteroidales TaxID=171549 RepID=UPI00244DCBD5|nr:signal peptide peptidase SppA [Sangeribacter muris]MCI9029425.1 signal peptide peptidase SppA [Muribaculaceae bacterium]
MLKKFFLNTLSSFVGAWIALVLFGVVGVIVAVGLVAGMHGTDEVASVKKHSILTLELSGSIVESETPSSINYTALMSGGIEKPQTLNVIVEGLKEGADNKNIDALYIKCGAALASPATFNAIREAVKEFKKTGKKVYAYGDVYTLGTYYVASVSDKIFLNPYGEIAIQGLGSTSMYLKGLFDKLGVEFQVVKVGTFKSAVEPYISTQMSEPARAQLDTLFSTMWDFMKDGICDNRKKLSGSEIDSLVNNGLMFSTAEFAAESGFVDEVVYERVMDERLAKLIDVDKKKLNFVSPSTLIGQLPWTDAYSSKNNIAVLYATGEIVDGASTGINYQKLVPIITQLADDDKIKGLVLRVNSPGGSAFGSDQIGEALDYFQSKKKPLAVSMGDYAASGGYWISCGADRIFADPLTITGSIGIFGLIPNVKGLSDKLGINPQSVSTNPAADFPTLFTPMDEKQLSIMQKYVETGYDRFIKRVATGRKMTEAKVRQIAEGRVWNAMKAKEIGLVDELGSLKDAIEWTAKKADIYSKYDVSVYPVYEPSFWDVISMGDIEAVRMMKAVSDGDFDEAGMHIAMKILSRSRILARMPEFEVTLGN